MVPGPDGRAEWRRGRGRAGRAAWCTRGSRAREQVTGRTPCRKSPRSSLADREALASILRRFSNPCSLGYDTTTSLRGLLARTWRRTPRPPRVSVEGSLRREAFSLPRRCARAGTVPLGGEDSCHSCPTCPAPTDIVPVVASRIDRATKRSAGGRRVRSVGEEPRSPHAVRRALQVVYAARRGDQSPRTSMLGSVTAARARAHDTARERARG